MFVNKNTEVKQTTKSDDFYGKKLAFLFFIVSIALAQSQILLECAERHTERINEMSRESLKIMCDRYFLHSHDLTPKVYYRITNNWLELTVRLLCSKSI